MPASHCSIAGGEAGERAFRLAHGEDQPGGWYHNDVPYKSHLDLSTPEAHKLFLTATAKPSVTAPEVLTQLSKCSLPHDQLCLARSAVGARFENLQAAAIQRRREQQVDQQAAGDQVAPQRQQMGVAAVPPVGAAPPALAQQGNAVALQSRFHVYHDGSFEPRAGQQTHQPLPASADHSTQLLHSASQQLPPDHFSTQNASQPGTSLSKSNDSATASLEQHRRRQTFTASRACVPLVWFSTTHVAECRLRCRMETHKLQCQYRLWLHCSSCHLTSFLQTRRVQALSTSTTDAQMLWTRTQRSYKVQLPQKKICAWYNFNSAGLCGCRPQHP